LVLGVPALPTALPGVPPLPPGFVIAAPILALGDVSGIPNPVAPGQWGIFDTSGQPILDADAVDNLEYARDYRISDYPQEQGAFESYNKVQLPYEAKVGFLVAQTRVEFLNSIEDIMSSLDLVSVVSPEITYPNANLVRYGYRRVARNGVSMILVEVWCEEVRETASASLSNTQSPNGQDTQNGGTVQPTGNTSTAPPSTTQQFNDLVNQQSTTNPGPTSLTPSTYQPSLNTPGFTGSSFSQGTQAQQQTIANLGTQQGASSAVVNAPNAAADTLFGLK